MTTKQLLIKLSGNGLPFGELKAEMFKFYNGKVGESIYMLKHENPNTGCGSCIQRVKINIWKWYHNDASAPEYKGFNFTGKFGVRMQPIYIYTDPKKKVIEDVDQAE